MRNLVAGLCRGLGVTVIQHFDDFIAAASEENVGKPQSGPCVSHHVEAESRLRRLDREPTLFLRSNDINVEQENEASVVGCLALVALTSSSSSAIDRPVNSSRSRRFRIQTRS
jgi:hypothetical protein